MLPAGQHNHRIIKEVPADGQQRRKDASMQRYAERM